MWNDLVDEGDGLKEEMQWWPEAEGGKTEGDLRVEGGWSSLWNRGMISVRLKPKCVGKHLRLETACLCCVRCDGKEEEGTKGR